MKTTSLPLSFWSPPAWAVMILGLVGVIVFKMVLPLASALVLYLLITETHRLLMQRLPSSWSPRWSMMLALIIGLGLFLGVLTLVVVKMIALVDTERGVGAFTIRLTEALGMLKSALPSWIASYLPANAYSLIQHTQTWLSGNADVLADLGKKMVNIVFRVTVGAFIGLLVAIRTMSARQHFETQLSIHPYIDELAGHVARFTEAFKRVFFAQLYISALNTVFTGLFLGIIMPLLGWDMPFLTVLVILTFILGFIPILGNIISNTAITLTALSLSPTAAFLALVFLVIIHKLEYFLNAMIVGSKINVRSYELLMAMLVCDALFGVWGLVMAPILYSYIKQEFVTAGKLLRESHPE